MRAYRHSVEDDHWPIVLPYANLLLAAARALDGECPRRRRAGALVLGHSLRTRTVTPDPDDKRQKVLR